MKKRLLALACTLALACSGLMMLAGCSSSNDEEEVQESEYQVIGTESEDALSILVFNNMGDEIDALSIRESSDDEFPASMMTDDAVIADGETVQLYYVPETEDSFEAQMSVTCSDDTEYVLTIPSLDEVTSLTLELSDGVAYCTYELADGTSDDTLSLEQDLIAQAEAQAAAQAEEEAAMQAQSSSSTSSTSSGSSSSGSSTSSGSSGSSNSSSSSASDTASSGSGVSQSEDECVEGGVQFRE